MPISVRHFIMHSLVTRDAKFMDESDQQSSGQRAKWRGRIEVSVLIVGGLILLIPTLAVLMASVN